MILCVSISENFVIGKDIQEKFASFAPFAVHHFIYLRRVLHVSFIIFRLVRIVVKWGTTGVPSHSEVVGCAGSLYVLIKKDGKRVDIKIHNSAGWRFLWRVLSSSSLNLRNHNTSVLKKGSFLVSHISCHLPDK